MANACKKNSILFHEKQKCQIKWTNATALHNRGASAAAFTVILKENYRIGKTRGNDRFLYRNIQVRPNEQRGRQTMKNVPQPGCETSLRLNNVEKKGLTMAATTTSPSASTQRHGPNLADRTWTDFEPTTWHESVQRSSASSHCDVGTTNAQFTKYTHLIRSGRASSPRSSCSLTRLAWYYHTYHPSGGLVV